MNTIIAHIEGKIISEYDAKCKVGRDIEKYIILFESNSVQQSLYRLCKAGYNSGILGDNGLQNCIKNLIMLSMFSYPTQKYYNLSGTTFRNASPDMDFGRVFGFIRYTAGLTSCYEPMGLKLTGALISVDHIFDVHIFFLYLSIFL